MEMNYYLVLIFTTILISTLMYYYLHKKTGIRKKYMYDDNIVVILSTIIISIAITKTIIPFEYLWHSLMITIALVGIIGFGITMIRFWRKPRRKVNRDPNKIVSPADGNIIYIKKIDKGELPISVKNKKISKLHELTKTELLKTPCWLVGINMTPFDVHRNCSPISGEITFQKHTPGSFLSLKSPESESENERNTFVIENDKLQVGVVQIASKLVRAISTYKKTGVQVEKGDWIGMIRFGSQVDVILPINYNINISLKEQIYAGKTILAEYNYANIN